MTTGQTKQPGLGPWRIVLAGSMVALVGACTTAHRVSNPSIGNTVRHAASLDDLDLVAYADPTADMSEDDKVTYLRLEAIENYRAYIELLPEGSGRREAMRRLADLLVSQGPSDDDSENARRETEAASLLDQAESPIQHSSDSDYGRRAGATGIYANLLREHPGESDNDTVRYQLARAYVNEGQPAKAVEVLQELVQKHPESELVSEANFRAGEILFILRDFDGAEHAYLRVLGSPEANGFHEHARYKLGWSLFKQTRYADSLDAFHVLLDKLVPESIYSVSDETIDTALESLDRSTRNLIQDTFRVSSLAFTYMDADLTISEYLATREKRHYEAILYAKLADTYSSKDRYSEAAQTYGQFVSANQLHPLAPLFSYQAITAWEQGGFVDEMLRAKADYAQRFTTDTEYWNTHSVEDGDRVVAQVRDFTAELAQHYHAVAQQGRDAGDEASFSAQAEVAKVWYNSFLSQYRDDERAPDLNFKFAELLFDSGEFKQAANQYTYTAYEYETHPKSADAGYASVYALDRYTVQVARSSTPEQAEQVVTATRALIDASLKFADTFPAHPEVPAVLVSTAEDLYELNDLEAAIAIATQALEYLPTPDAAIRYSAWLTRANAQFDQSRWVEAEVAFSEALALHPQLSDQTAEQRNTLIESLAASIYKQAEQQRTDGELLLAADNFLRILSVTPTASIVSTAHYDAANVLIEAKDHARAAATLISFRSAYPSDTRQSEVDRKLAQVYLDDNKPGLAAAEFTRIGRNGNESSDAQGAALWRAAELYDEAQQFDQSPAAYELYLSNFPAPLARAIDARQRLIELASARGDIAKQRYWQSELLKADQAGGESRNPRTRQLASVAALDLADEADIRFDAVTLRLPLQTTLAAKKERLQSAIEAYKLVVGYRYADQVPKASYKIAELYARFGSSIMTSERPPRLDEIELEEYGYLLEDQALPFEEKAIAAHESNAARLHEGLDDTWVLQSLERLAELVPGRYAKQERSDNYVESLQ